ncbi:MAG: hypothetical protein OXF68_11925 [Gammaproteobacteria bacterium]|nr:hypothetical protein [Gammaproteobacteria bacterium]
MVIAAPVAAKNCAQNASVWLEVAGRNVLMGCNGGRYASLHETGINIGASGGAICRDGATARLRIAGVEGAFWLQWHTGSGWSYIPGNTWFVDVTEGRRHIRIRPGSLASKLSAGGQETFTMRLEKAAPMNGSLPQDQYQIHGQRDATFHRAGGLPGDDGC